MLGGFALIEAANLDEAIELAARVPAAQLGGAVEVRPVVPSAAAITAILFVLATLVAWGRFGPYSW